MGILQAKGPKGPCTHVYILRPQGLGFRDLAAKGFLHKYCRIDLYT